MANKPKIIFIGQPSSQEDRVIHQLQETYEVDVVDSPIRARDSLEGVSGIYISSEQAAESLQLARLLKNERILEGMPDGVALLDSDNSILWANDCLRHWLDRQNLVGSNFYQVLGNPEILGPDYCPFHTALATGEASSSTLRCSDNRYYHVHCVPFYDVSDSTADNLIVTVRDVTSETLQQQKMAAIHKAGIALADLTADEVFQMHVDDRID